MRAHAHDRKRFSILEPIDTVLPCSSKVKKWAFENAYTLIFASFFFFVSWIITVITAVWIVHSVNQ